MGGEAVTAGQVPDRLLPGVRFSDACAVPVVRPLRAYWRVVQLATPLTHCCARLIWPGSPRVPLHLWWCLHGCARGIVI
jgi:hypothetical protein